MRDLHEAARLLTVSGWRDYFQRAYAALATASGAYQEPNKTGWRAEEYAGQLPDDIAQGRPVWRSTDSAPNYARQWLSAQPCSCGWPPISCTFGAQCWQSGARWFLTHLFRRRSCHNNLSWQWVASTFSHKPHIFNRSTWRNMLAAPIAKAARPRWLPARRCSYEALAAVLPRMSGGEVND